MSTENTVDKVKLISELKEIHSELFQIYKRLFDFKYKHNEVFKSFIDKEYKENGVGSKEKKAWNDNFCHRASYTLLNKILFVRICEDKGFMRNEEDYIAGEVKDPHIGEKLSKVGLQKWGRLITNYTLGELIKFAFNDMKQSYSNIVLYKEDKYEILNPKDEDFNLKYIDGDKETKTLVLDFENALNNIIEKLDTSNFNFKYTDGNILGDVYEKFMDRETRKAIGQFYTPEFVIEYILKSTVEEADIVEKPFVSVADISCGSGHFLIMAYDILREKFLSNLEKLRERYSKEVYTIKKDGNEIPLTGNEYWTKEHIHYHILKHCIYGADIDSFAVQLTTINLLLKDLDNFTDELNIIECDSLIKWESDYDWQELKEQLKEEFETITTTQTNLFGEEEKFETVVRKENYKLKYKDISGISMEETVNREKAEEILTVCEFWNTKFSYVVGNPPYVGHKQLSMQYKEWLLCNYSDVFKDKSDLSFCFFHRITRILSDQGKSAIITSRYFMESPTGKSLRLYLEDKTDIIEIVDFYGAEIFKGVGVATSIYMFKKQNNAENMILVNKLLDDSIAFDDNANLRALIETDLFENFQINQQILEEERWILIPENQYRIYKKITGFSNYKLEDVADSFQGIITGCDKAFVMSEEEIVKNSIEQELLKKWIKNSNVKKYKILESDLNLIYSDLIENEKQYPNSLKFIKNYIDKLENRRECKSGVRKWYELQWGRNSELFEQKKIVFPYKGKTNKFALDLNNSYCSADVYSLILREKFKEKVPLEYLVGVLNSNIYEFYFKLFAKKMGKGVYDYYPNSIMDLKITLDSNIVEKVYEKVKGILRNYALIKEIDVNVILAADDPMEYYFRLKFDNVILKEKIYYLEKEIDNILGHFFGLDDADFDTIKKVLNLSDFQDVKLLLSKEKFYNEYIVEKSSIKEIAEKYTIEEELVEFIWAKYIYDYTDMNGNENRVDLEELKNTVFLYLSDKSIEILEINNAYLEIQNIKDRFDKGLFDFKKITNIFKIDDIKTTSMDIIKQSLNLSTYTWNAYRKDKSQDKVGRTFVKYYDNNYYGLAEWTDEIHKQYFMDAIDEYTSNNPNEKKANDILKLFKELDIEDKEDYVDIIEDKIKRAFS